MATSTKKTESTAEVATTTPAVKVTSGYRAILIKPRISEKASHAATNGKYIFVVAKQANKVEVKKAIEKSYKVTVTQVNIINTEGKKRNYGRTNGKMSDFKKAIVTLKAGQKIEGVTETI